MSAAQLKAAVDCADWLQWYLGGVEGITNLVGCCAREVARLSPEERAKLRAQLDSLETFSDPKVMEEWTQNNRAAEAGGVVSRHEAIDRLKAAGKRVD